MQVHATQVSLEALRNLPTSARPCVDPNNLVLFEGYRAEVGMAGLSFPTAIEFAPDGTVFVAKGGSTWPTRPYMPVRLLSLDPSGKLDVLAIEGLGGPKRRAWSLPVQKGEVAIAAAVLNGMIRTAKPVSIRVA